MKLKTFLQILVLIIFLGLGVCQAEEDIFNVFRYQPLNFSSLTGVDNPEDLKPFWPEPLWRRLVNGLKEIKPLDLLNEIAAQRAEEIFLEGLPLSESFEGGLQTLLQERGFSFLLAGESFAVLAFENPLPQKEAYSLLIKNLMAAALKNDPRATALLFPCWEAMGKALKYGDLVIDGEIYHAAVLVLVFTIPQREGTPPALVGKVFGISEESAEDVKPLAGVHLKLQRRNGAGVLETATFSDGTYCFEGYQAANFLLETEKEGFERKKLILYLPPFPHHLDLYLFPY